MPSGFPAYEEEAARFRGAKRKELMRASLDALDDLGLHPRKDGNNSIRAAVPMGFCVVFLTWGAELTVEIDDGAVFVRSEATTPLAWIDFGQHGGQY